MSIENQTKINQLLSSQPAGIVLQTAWLAENGYSWPLQQSYRRHNWLTSIGQGAMIRTGEKVGYEGGIYALQKQMGLKIHPGGRTALSLLGKAHYLELAATKAIIFGAESEKLPGWFKKYDWGVKLEYYQTSFLPKDAGLREIELKNFSIWVSNSTRAVMECIHLAPKKQDLLECFELMEGLNDAKPLGVQSLLEQCNSVKVKRLFLYMAEKAGHRWFNSLDLAKVDLGKGKRSIVKDGVYIPKYHITVPKELEEKNVAGRL